MILNGACHIQDGIGGNVNKGNESATYLLAAALCLFSLNSYAQANPEAGEAEFKAYCAECHAGGGNLVNPAKTLSRVDREANGIKTVKDIMYIMRNPGEGMTMFDEKTLPTAEAGKIAEYIINTFK